MKLKQIFGLILLAGAVYGLGNKLVTGSSGFVEDGLLIVFILLIVGLFLMLGIRQILRS